jgi:16S rRNA (adenine1518-N6/adenine1519-N6)-dimethyltransferase
LGQHFLTNQHFIDEIAEAAVCTLGDGIAPVLEIGPGCGVLTAALAARVSQLSAVELDDTAAAFLQANAEEFFPQLKLIHDDVLNVDMAALYDKPLVIVGNLPYNLSVKIVEHCTGYVAHICRMVFMFQREVAARIAARPNCKDYSSLSVFCNYHYDIAKLRDISGGNFWPNANVYSTVLIFTPKKPLLARKDEAAFFKFLRQAFVQKRKTLRNNLKSYNTLPAVLASLGLAESVRAEELALEQFIEIYRGVS